MPAPFFQGSAARSAARRIRPWRRPRLMRAPSRAGKCHRKSSVAALRRSRLDLVVVALVGDEDMAGDRKAARVVEAPRRDADVVASYCLPEQRGAATAAKPTARLVRGRITPPIALPPQATPRAAPWR